MDNPLGDLMSSSWFANRFGAAAAEFISHWATKADALLLDIDTVLDEFDTIIDENTIAPTYDPNTGAISWVHTPPTTVLARGNYSSLQPTQVTLPARGGVLTDEEFNALVASARSNVSRAAAGNTFGIMYEQAGMGLGMVSAAQTVALRNANQKTAELASQAILELTAKRGEWNREDYFRVLEAELQTFRDRAQVTYDRLKAEEATLLSNVAAFNAEVQTEGERRGWTQSHINQIMAKAKEGADVYVQWGTATFNRVIAAKEILIKVKAQLAQALLSASDASLSAQGSQDINTSG